MKYITEIKDWITVLIPVGYALVITALLIATLIRKKKAAGEKVTITDVLGTLPQVIIKFMSTAENAYNVLTGATGIKAGTFKLDYVLNKVRDWCNENSVPFDSEWVTNYINSVCDFQNINDREHAVQSSGQSINVQFMGGNK